MRIVVSSLFSLHFCIGRSLISLLCLYTVQQLYKFAISVMEEEMEVVNILLCAFAHIMYSCSVVLFVIIMVANVWYVNHS